MTTRVCILATCLGGDLNATMLVFKTLRIGFPTADVLVFGNGLAPAHAPVVKKACLDVKAGFVSVPRTSHDAWIQTMIEASPVPFWISDTDVVFHSSVEGFATPETLFKGRYEPPFIEPWSKTQKVQRLHTSLLYLNAPMLRINMTEWIRRWHPPGFPFRPSVEMIRQRYVPQGAEHRPLFYDTCAGLYLALGGESFSDQENAAFDHLHCATYVDRMGDAIPGLAAAHAEIYANPAAAVMMKAPQDEFYERQKAN